MSFPAFKYKNYRLYFVGQGASLIGTWMQRIATSWLVYRLTDSEILLGLTAFSSQILTFVFAPIAGVLVEDLDKRKVIIWTQVFASIQALLLFGLLYVDSIQIWHVILLNLILGAINAFDMPSRQSYVLELIDFNREHLQSAISLNASLFNAARLIGPTIAGALIAIAGEKICFFINATTFMILFVTLLFIKTKKIPLEVKKHKESFSLKLREGVNFVLKTPEIFKVMVLIVVISCFGASYMVLLPVVATKVFLGDSKVFGYLSGAAGLGAFVGAIFLGSSHEVRKLQRYIIGGASIYFFGLMAFAFSTNYYLTLVILFIIGLGGVSTFASANTLVQTLTPDSHRTRVMSLYIMTFMGAFPLGSMLTGFFAEKIGMKETLVVNAIICLLFWCYYTLGQKRLSTLLAHNR